MTTAIDDILARETAETLEKLAFLFAYPGSPDDAADPDAVTARIAFSGDFNGCLAIRIAAGALPELTANMLGLDEGEPIAETQQHDALKETLNIICGNILPAIAGHTAVFDLAPPQIATGDAIAEAGQQVGSAVLALDQGSLQVWLRVEGDPDLLQHFQG